MQPTLEPGDFILVDTWQYQSKKPNINDVIVFSLPDQEMVMVKRISPWPGERKVKENAVFVRGDNSKASRDSRHFGAVELENIKGHVKIVLLSIDTSLNVRHDRWFLAEL